MRDFSVPYDLRPTVRGGSGVGGSGAGGGPASFQGRAGAAPASGPGDMMRFPPDYFPPWNATDFFIQGTAAGLASPSPLTQVGADVQLPGQSVGVIRDIQLGISAMTTATAVVFSIFINGAPALGGWGSLTIAPRAAGYVSASYLPESTRVLVPAGSLVQCFVQLNAGGPSDVSMSLHGWFWPEN